MDSRYTLNDCVDDDRRGGAIVANCGGNILLGIIWLGGRVDFVGRLAAISRNECIWILKNQNYSFLN